jgi:metallo-beta-lactamase family protein
MKFHAWGAAGEVTGSCHILEINGRRLVLDAGLFQGQRKQAFEQNRRKPLDPKTVDAIILSHAHMDHAGNLPTWVRGGYRGAIHATEATRDLSELMLRDSAHIQMQDLIHVNKRRRREGKSDFEPLYEDADCDATIEQFRLHHYGESFEPIPGVRAHFIDAGHMLGSATVVLDIEEAGKSRRFVFSGDIGHKGSPLLNPPVVPEGADVVLMETTYGDRLHEGRYEAEGLLQRAAAEVIHLGGKLLIPAFAVGRTQEVVFHLNRLFEDRKLPPLDVFVDSPLATNVTEVFRRHSELMNDAVRLRARKDEDRNPFGFEGLTYTRDVEESKSLNFRKEPCAIVSASGMCEAGRILHHLKNHLGKSNTTVLFVGFQAEHTLGRKLLEGMNPVPVFGEPVAVRARLLRAEGFSGHADRDGLLAWFDAVRERGSVDRVFLVHGENGPRSAFAEALKARGVRHVEQPMQDDRFEF